MQRKVDFRSFILYNVADGRISDIFGRKSAYMFAQAAFFVGSILCGVAPNLNFLIVARVIAGTKDFNAFGYYPAAQLIDVLDNRYWWRRFEYYEQRYY